MGFVFCLNFEYETCIKLTMSTMRIIVIISYEIRWFTITFVFEFLPQLLLLTTSWGVLSRRDRSRYIFCLRE